MKQQLVASFANHCCPVQQCVVVWDLLSNDVPLLMLNLALAHAVSTRRAALICCAWDGDDYG